MVHVVIGLLWERGPEAIQFLVILVLFFLFHSSIKPSLPPCLQRAPLVHHPSRFATSASPRLKMPRIFCQRQDTTLTASKSGSSSTSSLNESVFAGTHRVTYRPGKEWDFKACTEDAHIDLDLAMPPHRPRSQPENHRTGMLVTSETGSIRVKVCRYALNRSMHLVIKGGRYSNVTVYIPSDFSGFISCTGSRASFSPAFVERVLPNAHLNRTIPHAWAGDEINIATGGDIAFRVWDVFECAPEREQKRTSDVWRRMFRSSKRIRSPSPRSPTTPTSDWDFLIEDDD